jgi:lipopolysaccharide biosynthesis regulator YciM
MSPWAAAWQELFSPFTLVLTGLFVLAALMLVSLRRRGGRAAGDVPEPPSDSGWPPYDQGTDLLPMLVSTIKANPNRVLEYLELGKLLRRRGEHSRAVWILRQLLARPTLERAVRADAQYELGLGYRAMGLYEPAVSTLEGLLRADPLQSAARQALRQTHEEMGCWEQAVAVEKLRVKRGEATNRRTLAALRTQQGKAAWAAGDARRSVAHLLAALALDPQATEAQLTLGCLWLQQGKLRKAERIWQELAQTRPEFLYLAFRDMQAALRRLRHDARWETFLEAFTQRHPDDPTGHLALAEWCASQGRPADAMARLRRVLELDPLSQEAHLALVTLYRQQGMPAEVCETYEMLARASASARPPRFRCRRCGHTMGEPFWRCPTCQVWDTPERLMPPAGSPPLLTSEPSQETAAVRVDGLTPLARVHRPSPPIVRTP